MIESPDAFPLLVQACPSFRPAWEAHLREWGNDVLYIAAGNLADHLLALLGSGRIEAFAPVAQAIERLLVEGTPEVQTLAVVGVIEGIQNGWANQGTDPGIFGAYLGPEGRRNWQALNEFWGGAGAGEA